MRKFIRLLKKLWYSNRNNGAFAFRTVCNVETLSALESTNDHAMAGSFFIYERNKNMQFILGGPCRTEQYADLITASLSIQKKSEYKKENIYSLLSIDYLPLIIHHHHPNF